jgi:methionyl-tRNA formyltransferase
LNIKILSAHLTNIPSTLMPGKITKISNEGIFVATKTNDLCLTKIQLPSKQPITIKEMINGHHIFKINGLFS